jgi:hypothetical protein
MAPVLWPRHIHIRRQSQCPNNAKEKKLVTDLFKGLQKALADGNEKPLL